MKQVTIYPGRLEGEINIPASKSMGHRAVICAGLAEATSNIYNIGMSEDIEATCQAMRVLGVRLEKQGAALSITGNRVLELQGSSIECRESGSTLRFIIPIAALAGGPVAFHGQGRLGERSLEPYFRIFEQQSIQYETDRGRLPLRIYGSLAPGEFRLEGNISSQFISGLMFALPLLDGASRITIAGSLESKPYVELTMNMLKKFSITVENNGYKEFIIKGKQKYRAADYTVEGDFSQAAFWLAAGVLGGRVSCRGLDMDSLQGDKEIVDILGRMGAGISVSDGIVRATASTVRGTVIDASQCPDLVPVLAVMGALGRGRTEIVNAGRLRLKESDRLKAISTELSKLGANIEEKPEGLVIEGAEELKGGSTDSWNDHRIAMALAVAAVKCREPVTISNAGCVKKSYPEFWDHYKALGGKTDERIMG